MPSSKVAVLEISRPGRIKPQTIVANAPSPGDGFNTSHEVLQAIRLVDLKFMMSLLIVTRKMESAHTPFTRYR
jgi:hypothetical protein